MNLVEARIEGDSVTFGEHTLPLGRDRRPRETEDGGRVILGIRPEVFEEITFAASGLPTMDVEVEVLEELGSDAHVFFPIAAEQVIIDDALTDDPDDETSILAETRDRTLMTARVDARSHTKIGSTITLAVDPERLYFFSPSTGESLLDGVAAAVA
jgi:multiple sugar transport system ATP-binding protein